ncbi:copper radical oxidase [Nemania serpens]|nr:copper radical oxidase [Nemania serpens]
MTSLRRAAVTATLAVQVVTASMIPRALTIPKKLSKNWTYVNCYIDGVDGTRALDLDGYTNTINMTVESCVLFCMDKGYPMAGAENGGNCYCGEKVNEKFSTVGSVECNTPCAGDSSEPCGGENRLSVYAGAAGEPTPPSPIEGWAYEGCFSEGNGGRTLAYRAKIPGGSAATTNELCTAACKAAGYPLAGTESAGECYCGDVYSNAGAQVQTGCIQPCNGDASSVCGGADRLSVWSLIGSGFNPTESVFAAPSAPSPSPLGTVPSLPGTWAYKGCYTEGSNGRAFATQQPDSDDLTIQSCVATCISAGYGVAGLEYAAQCFCDDFLRNGANLTDEADCSMPCTGDASQLCGAGNRLSVFSNDTVVVYQPPSALTENLPGSWEYYGCVVDAIDNRVLPWMSEDLQNTTIEACLAGCSRFGYNAGGVEYGYQCFCGDSVAVTKSPEADCTVPCPGDPHHLCGGGNRISYYQWTGAALTTWTYAQGNAAGRYDFLMSAPLLPLISVVGINNKVVFVEKHGTQVYDNSSGSFEFDPTLAPQYGTAFRELQLKTDVFCSASLVLPDKAGRQINVGGWSADSLYGVRLFTPEPGLGKNGTNDWEEDFTKLKLLDARWYPTAMTLSNGSILVMAGEDGSDGPVVPTCEILPRPAGVTTSTYLDYLENVEKINSYPFLSIMPSGDIFFAQYNEARLISQTDFSTTKMLPKMPGAVNNPESGRNYPLQGTLVLLPQSAPYTDPMSVLICGGTTDGANFGLDNCISTQPEVAGAQWAIERMPSTRVVTCMVNLPDGRYLILNGAVNGRAGFGLAQNPNKAAVLYDPNKPIGSRMTQLASSTIARLYHSEAVLMNDGRVLVSGSDPQDQINPEEYRLEYFSPDYILSGAPKPTFTIVNKDWAYGQTVPFTLTSTFSGAVKVSLIAAVGSTHGNNMGQRTIFPAFTCAGSACTVTAPPNAKISPPAWYQLFVLDGPTPSHSVWVRIGGDPASIGNWPNLPGFTFPGI